MSTIYTITDIIFECGQTVYHVETIEKSNSIQRFRIIRGKIVDIFFEFDIKKETKDFYYNVDFELSDELVAVGLDLYSCFTDALAAMTEKLKSTPELIVVTKKHED